MKRFLLVLTFLILCLPAYCDDIKNENIEISQPEPMKSIHYVISLDDEDDDLMNDVNDKSRDSDDDLDDSDTVSTDELEAEEEDFDDDEF